MATPPVQPSVYGLGFGKKVALQTVDTAAAKLGTISLDNNSFPTTAMPGTLIGNILGLTNGSKISLLSPLMGAVQLVSDTIQVGPLPPVISQIFDIQIIETHGNQTNSTVIPIIVFDTAPTINSPATIMGTPFVGSPITATDAVWNFHPVNVIYQWQAAGVNATGAGATTLTYTPVVGDVGETLTLTVIASNLGGTSAPSTSAPSSPVMATVSDVLAIALKLSVSSLPIGA